MSALRLLWRRLRAEAERTAATPSERLLDDALQLLGAPHHSQLRQLEVPPPSPPRPPSTHTRTYTQLSHSTDVPGTRGLAEARTVEVRTKYAWTQISPCEVQYTRVWTGL